MHLFVDCSIIPQSFVFLIGDSVLSLQTDICRCYWIKIRSKIFLVCIWWEFFPAVKTTACFKPSKQSLENYVTCVNLPISFVSLFLSLTLIFEVHLSLQYSMLPFRGALLKSPVVWTLGNWPSRGTVLSKLLLGHQIYHWCNKSQLASLKLF